MYGLIVKLTAAPGRRDDLITMMGGSDSSRIPGCLSFIVAMDAAEDDVLWITEVWASQASHEASLQAPAIKDNLTDADTLIAGFEKIATTSPVQGSSHPFHGEA
jgi:quinol monooxygenase YgiN